jgi:hypothetical protein
MAHAIPSLRREGYCACISFAGFQRELQPPALASLSFSVKISIAHALANLR